MLISFSIRFFLPFLGGKNPSNKNLSVGNPELTKAAKTADGPGTASTLEPISIAFLTNLYAGSEIAGVPASVITATSLPSVSYTHLTLPTKA